MSSALSTSQKLHLLGTAIAQPFTTKSALIAHLASQYPQIAPVDIEAFLDDLVDFEAVQKFKSLNEDTLKNYSIQSVERLPDTKDDSKDDTTVYTKTEIITVNMTANMDDNSEIAFSRPHSAPPSPSAEPLIVAPTPSPPLVVPARTPSGRTLRSNSTVNTSEPRRLRSNK